MIAARQREHKLKGLSRAKKNALVEAVNPQRSDLFEELAKGETGV